MAMSIEPDRRRPVATINVTPMADVMITLLIIFMVTAPMFGRDDHVHLPEARNGLDLSQNRELVIRVRDDGSVLRAGRRSETLAPLAEELRDRPELRPESSRLGRIEADASLPYSRVAWMRATRQERKRFSW
jgi:biopolymer transport protein ExbD